MRIVDLLSKDSILLNASPKNKAEAIDLPVSYTHLTLPTT